MALIEHCVRSMRDVGERKYGIIDRDISFCLSLSRRPRCTDRTEKNRQLKWRVDCRNLRIKLFECELMIITYCGFSLIVQLHAWNRQPCT